MGIIGRKLPLKSQVEKELLKNSFGYGKKMPESDFSKPCVILIYFSINQGFSCQQLAVTPWPVAVPSRERRHGPEDLGPTPRLGGHFPG